MSDEAALLAAILAHPDEDTPRLMYADWLQENGQPERAEFIRLQCAVDADEAAEERAFELEARNRMKWLAGLPQFPRARWEFRRGFPEHIDASGAVFLDRYDGFARAPWLRFVCLLELRASLVRDFANRPWNPQWVELELQADPFDAEGDLTDSAPAAEVVADCPQTARLRCLHLSLFELTEDSVVALAMSPYLRNLHRLQLDGERDDPKFALLHKRFGDRLVIG